MAIWTDGELDRIGNAEELELVSFRHDKSRGPYVTMWVVRAGYELYARSAGGPDRPWYRRARASGAGRIRAGGVEAKYDRYGPTIVGHVTGPDTEAVTIRLVRKDTSDGDQ